MKSTQRLVERLVWIHCGEPWHGASVREVLGGISPQQARARPLQSAHSIWEIVLHMTAWLGEARQRLQEGATPGNPVEGDWPAVTDPSDAAWERTLAAHEAAHAALVHAVNEFPAERLDRRPGDDRDQAPAAGATYEILLDGIVDHELYHSGQIGILKKASSTALPARTPPSGASP